MRSRLPSTLALILLAACGGDGDDPGAPDGATSRPDASSSQPDAHVGTFTVSGSVDPGPGPGPTVVFWSVFGPSEYFYKLGEGDALAGTFTLDLEGTPPPAARIQVGDADFGVGQVLLLPSGWSIPDGIVAKFTFSGIAGRHAIIYRAPADPGTQPAWLADFPIGLSCGQCVDSPAPTGFDSFAPAACDSFAIGDLGSDVCEWY
jgi:hypothetical protein